MCIGAEMLHCTQVLLDLGKLINYADTPIQQTFTIREVWRERVTGREGKRERVRECQFQEPRA